MRPASKYRSEVFWAHSSGEEIELREGDRFSCRFEVTPHLGDAVDDHDQWQVLMNQLCPSRNDWND